MCFQPYTTMAANEKSDTGTRVRHLPPEIWLMILDILTPSFFQDDIRRLTICKQWYYLVEPFLYNRIEWTPGVISRIVHSKSALIDEKLLVLRESLHTVTIVSKGPDFYYNTSANLPKFYNKLSEFQRLKSIRFVANHRDSFWAWPYIHKNGHLPIVRLENLVTGISSSTLSHAKSVKHTPWNSVTSLDIDLDGSFITWGGKTGHLCTILRPLTKRLHTLRIRTHWICPDVLGPLEKGEVYSVRYLRINLHLPVSVVNPKLNRAGMCSHGNRRLPDRPTGNSVYTWPQTDRWYDCTLESAMRRAMRRMISATPPDRRVELVHLAPNGEVHIWNAATDECVRDETVEKIDLGKWLSSEGECFSRDEDCREDGLQKGDEASEEEDE
ncbi:hypothetical protein QBC40DRAFT_270878 [Triangularia verruculosa]|uniref:F-box domain-containing protein n=1 Tax=Triangularia verruculosa TaxID=2587418 RepID=A0AAN6XRY5_9PEZI|nr:hypothetical protein QBC40DRAFT_270878 [Triangularia verruculosa]